MEKFHPYLYLGFPGFTEYPNVIYSWVVMLFLVVASLVITKALQVIPHGGQNIFETLFDAVAGFMDGTLGPQEGRISRWYSLCPSISFCVT